MRHAWLNPTLFLPNMNTGMDDQLARTMLGAEEGWAVINKDRSVKGLRKASMSCGA